MFTQICSPPRLISGQQTDITPTWSPTAQALPVPQWRGRSLVWVKKSVLLKSNAEQEIELFGSQYTKGASFISFSLTSSWLSYRESSQVLHKKTLSTVKWFSEVKSLSFSPNLRRQIFPIFHSLHHATSLLQKQNKTTSDPVSTPERNSKRTIFTFLTTGK